jgi:phosphate transport system protein
MASELRAEYHRELDRLDISLGALLSVVPDAVADATAALLSADAGVRVEVDRWRGMVDAISAEVDHTVEVVIARQAPVAGDLRFLMACIRLAPVLADTVDLVGDVGTSGATVLAGPLPPRVQELVAATGGAAADTWRTVAEAWHQRNALSAPTLRIRDDTLAEARSTLATELTGGSLDLPAAVDLAGVARCYQRIGRHAVSAGRLITQLVHPAGPPSAAV